MGVNGLMLHSKTNLIRDSFSRGVMNLRDSMFVESLRRKSEYRREDQMLTQWSAIFCFRVRLCLVVQTHPGAFGIDWTHMDSLCFSYALCGEREKLSPEKGKGSTQASNFGLDLIRQRHQPHARTDETRRFPVWTHAPGFRLARFLEIESRFLEMAMAISRNRNFSHNRKIDF